MQNSVNTYYIQNMYPNPMVKNHGIETFENFEKVIENSNNLDAIIILDAEFNRKNYEYAEKLYEKQVNKYNKKSYGDGTIVYERIK